MSRSVFLSPSHHVSTCWLPPLLSTVHTQHPGCHHSSLQCVHVPFWQPPFLSTVHEYSILGAVSPQFVHTIFLLPPLLSTVQAYSIFPITIPVHRARTQLPSSHHSSPQDMVNSILGDILSLPIACTQHCIRHYLHTTHSVRVKLTW